MQHTHHDDLPGLHRALCSNLWRPTSAPWSASVYVSVWLIFGAGAGATLAWLIDLLDVLPRGATLYLLVGSVAVALLLSFYSLLFKPCETREIHDSGLMAASLGQTLRALEHLVWPGTTGSLRRDGETLELSVELHSGERVSLRAKLLPSDEREGRWFEGSLRLNSGQALFQKEYDCNALLLEVFAQDVSRALQDRVAPPRVDLEAPQVQLVQTGEVAGEVSLDRALRFVQASAPRGVELSQGWWLWLTSFGLGTLVYWGISFGALFLVRAVLERDLSGTSEGDNWTWGLFFLVWIIGVAGGRHEWPTRWRPPERWPLPEPAERPHLALEGPRLLWSHEPEATVDLEQPFTVKLSRAPLREEAPEGLEVLEVELYQPGGATGQARRLKFAVVVASSRQVLSQLPVKQSAAPVLEAVQVADGLWPVLRYAASTHGRGTLHKLSLEPVGVHA